ncbi:MAG: Zn-dependent oligopeptidase [Bacteroidota bacterium]|nr:Zn-dependent oligopeptidase [Bacteroidota bacterium]
MKNSARFLFLSGCVALIFIVRQNEAIGIPKPALPDEKPALSSHNPLMPESDQLFDFAKVNVEVIKTSAMYTENKVIMLLAQIGTADNGTRTFANTMMPLDEIYNTLQKFASVNELIASTSTDKNIRDAAGEMMAKFGTLTDELLQNEKLYSAIKNYSEAAEAKTLTGEKSFFVKRMIKQFALNGMSLPVNDRDTLKMLNSKMNELSVSFNKNISGDKTKVMFTKNELAGLSEDFIKAYKLPAPDPNYSFDMSTPTYIGFMSDCKNSKSRKKMYVAKMNVGGEPNEVLLVEIIKLRTRKAKLLGFNTYSEYATSDIMAQNTENVWKFEKSLATDLRVKANQDIVALNALKSEDVVKDRQQSSKTLVSQAEAAVGTRVPVYPYDAAYYSNRLLKENYNVDNEKVKEYFEMKNVIGGIFTVYQKLYNIRFVEDVKVSSWHKEVKAYTVFDNSTNERIGYFYLDLYPRADKYNHFGCFGLTGSKKFENGKKQLKSAALVCNFPPATADKPSLLPHSQVTTFFHEFGHLIHVLLSETELAYFAGTNVATDFVEAPSQIMENWVWKKEVLSLFAKHYKTGEVIPDTLLNNMIKARNLNSGLNMLQQVYYGTLDFTLNDGMVINSSADITAKAKELQNSVTLYPFVEGTHFAGTFGHLTGYGSKYYGYLWSLVYASDMFSEFEKNGPLNPEMGKRYHENVLAKGGSDDALNLVRNFLGREPDNKAFLKQIGL